MSEVFEGMTLNSIVRDILSSFPFELEDLILAKHEIDILRIEHEEITERSIFSPTDYYILIPANRLSYNSLCIFIT